MPIGSDLVDVVEHILVLLKGNRKLQKEEYRMLMDKIDHVRNAMSAMGLAALLTNVDICQCENCRRQRGEE